MLDISKQATLLDIRGVCRSFPKGSGEELLVLEKVDLTIRSGEIVGLLGRSGSGKSTLLRIIAGLVTPSAGDARCRGETIKVGGEDVKVGKFDAEKLVDLSKHNYTLEPNATFTPDNNWTVFRSNMHGPTHVYAVEVKKQEKKAEGPPLEWVDATTGHRIEPPLNTYR